jgi:predicted negative regulator of RcsB-dependent stress response
MEADVTQTALFFRVWTWVVSHRRQVIWGSAVLVVVASWAGFSYWRGVERERSANAALSRSLVPVLIAGQPASTEELSKVVAEYSGTSAAERAQLVTGCMFYGGGKYQEAKECFEKFLAQYPNSRFAGQARLGIASSLDAQGNATAAIVAYKDIIERHPNDDGVGQAKLALGRLYDTQGSFAQALECYGQIARPEFGSIGSEADVRMRDLITRQPSLIQPPPAPEPIVPAPTNVPALNPSNP